MALARQSLIATFFKAADAGFKRKVQVAYLHGPAGGATGIVAARAGRLVEVFQACTQITTSGAATYTAEQLLGGMISRSPNGANRTDTLPTAALLKAAFPDVQVNDTIRFYVYNSAGSGAYTVTVQAGASGTLVGSGVVGTGMIKEFLLQFTAVGDTPTYTCFQVEQNIGSGAYSGDLSVSGAASVGTTLAVAGTTALSDDVTLAAGKSLVFGASKVLCETITISAADLVSTSAGKLGHANGQILVAAPGAGKVLSFISAVMSYTFGVAAYTAGGNLTINIGGGGAALTGLISAANSLGAAASNITQFKALAVAAATLTANTGLNLVASSAFTQPGTATGTVKVFITYAVHTL